MRVGVIGLGSNSLRMLIADIVGDKLVNVFRDRAGLRIFAALKNSNGGDISENMMLHAIESIICMKQKAIALHIDEMFLFATSATRDASNSDEFTNRIYKKTGLKLELCSGDEEAFLSFMGATNGEESGMIDIGGGSTEFAIGKSNNVLLKKSLQMGAVRLNRIQKINCFEDVKLVQNIVLDILNPELPEILSAIENAKPMCWYGVGGTFTSLSALAQNIHWLDRKKVCGYTVDIRELWKQIKVITPMPLEERKKIPSLQKERADIIVHGMVILHTCLTALNIDQICTSCKGNLDGYLKNKYFNQ